MYTRPLLKAVLEITNRCNLRCPHCASGSGSARPKELSLQGWLRVLEELEELGCEEVTLIGGELFLNPDWPRIAEEVLLRKMALIIITNGLLVNDQIWSRLSDLDVYLFGVSLDGASRQTYRTARRRDGFGGAFGLLQRLAATGHPRVNAITTFTRQNLSDFHAFPPLLKGTGITWQVQIATTPAPRLAPDLFLTVEQYAAYCRDVTQLLAEPATTTWVCPMDDFGYFPLDGSAAQIHGRWQGCQAGLSVMGIRSDGGLLGCLSLGDPFVAGTLERTSLAAAWTGDAVFGMLRSKGQRLSGACRSCPKAKRCTAGCASLAYSATGTITENPYCLRRIQSEEILAAIF